MMINKLRINNFRAFYAKGRKYHTLQFKPGINLITGDNGSGKTSIIKAIYASLFGYEGLERDEIINDRHYFENIRTGKQPICSINLVMIDDQGNERNIIRSIKVGKKRSTEISLDGNDISQEELEWRLLDKRSFDLINLIGVELGDHARQFRQYRSSVESLFMVPYFKRILSSIRQITGQYEEETKTTSDQVEEWILKKEELLDEINELDEKLNEKMSDINENIQSLHELEKLEIIFQSELEEDITELEKSKEKCEIEHKDLIREYQDAQKNFRNLQKDVTLFIVFPKLIEIARKKAPSDKQPLEQLYYTVGKVDGKIELIDELQIKYNIKKLKKGRENLLKSFNGYLPKASELREAHRYIDFLQKSEEIENDLKESYKEISIWWAKLNQLKRQIENNERKMKKIEDDYEAIIKARGQPESRERIEKIGKFKEKIEKQKEEKIIIMDMKNRHESELEEILHNLAGIKETGSEVEGYKRKGYALMGFFKEYIENIVIKNIPEISNLANEYFLQVNQKPETFKSIKVTSDFDILLQEVHATTGKRWLPISARPSTGETDVIFLCISFAISKMTGTGFLIMDDVIINLDTEYRVAILKLLEKISFNQIILINKESSRDEIQKNLSITNSYYLAYFDQEATSKIKSGGV